MFDMTPYLDVGRFAELKNIEAFKQVSVSFDTIEWENDLDLDPEFLYAHSTIPPCLFKERRKFLARFGKGIAFHYGTSI